ncbi:MAG: glycosyltransferase [Elusimicrobia bacterium]|nr:glycosyltransferase [Elusimicrobiota bacterium]
MTGFNLYAALEIYQAGLLFYFIAVNIVYLALFLISLSAIVDYLHHKGYRNAQEVLRSRLTPPISVLVPAHNEAVSIVASVRSLLQLNYPEYEVIVINDGSTDRTLQALTEAFGLRKTKRVYHRTLPTAEVRGLYAGAKTFPWVTLTVIDKEKGGKADALNAGINVSQYPLFCSVDADSILERDSLLRVVMPFMERFAVMMGVGGIVRVANGCAISDGFVQRIRLPRRWLPCFQAVEYLRAFLSGRVAWSRMNGLLILSGAFSLFRKDPVLAAGGYQRGSVGEDMDLVVRLHMNAAGRSGPREIAFVPDPVCWTEVPESFKTLWRQRNRWHRGLGQSLAGHASLIFNPRFGLIGIFAAPYFWFVEFLSPVIELSGYAVFALSWALGSVRWDAFAAFLILSILMGVNLSLLAVLLEEFTLHRYPRIRDLLKLLACAVAENLGYRQFVSLARLHGLIDWLRNETLWGSMDRKGLQSAALFLGLLATACLCRASMALNAGLGYEDFSFAGAGRSSWIRVDRRLSRGSISGGLTRIERFGEREAQGELGLGARLGPSAGLELGASASPEAHILPEWSAAAVLYWNPRRPVTISPGLRSAGFRAAGVHTASLGIEAQAAPGLAVLVRGFGSVTQFRGSRAEDWTPAVLLALRAQPMDWLLVAPSFAYREESFEAGAPGSGISRTFQAHAARLDLSAGRERGWAARAAWEYERRVPKNFVRRYELGLSYRF